MTIESWSLQEFLLAAVLLSLVWYLGVWGLFFRKKRAGRSAVAAGGSTGAEPLSHGWDAGVDVLEEQVMGRSVPDPGVSVVAADEVSFAGPGKDEQLGVLADVQQEIKSACRELEMNLGKKADFLERFREIRRSYAIPSGSEVALGEFIREQVPFYLSEEELDSLWV